MQYVESLPAPRRTLYSTSLVVLTIVITQFVLVAIPGAVEEFGGTALARQTDAIDQILRTISEATRDLSSAGGLLVSLGTSPLTTIAFVGTSLMTVLYLELRPFVPAFRLKRSLCNLYPETDLLSSTPARWSVQRATGVYELERSVVTALGAPPPREVPFDLIVPALLTPAMLFLGGMFINYGIQAERAWWLSDVPIAQSMLSYAYGAAIITGAGARLGWLARAWMRRARPYGGPYLPSEVRIRRTGLIVALRDPVTIFWATAVAGGFCVGFGLFAAPLQHEQPLATAWSLILLFVVAPLWFRMNRDVAAYLAERGDGRPGRPTLSFLAMATGWLSWRPAVLIIASACVLVSVYNTTVRVRRAEKVAGAADTNLLPPLLLVPAIVLFPFLLEHVQRAINAVWVSDGEVLD